MIKQVIKKTIDLGDGRTITIETGKLAKQADGAVEVRMGNTMLLATVCSAQEAGEGVDFMPLQVEYKERYSAFGRFPGGFTKREGRASDYEILTARLVDRVLRPLFPDNYHADTFVNIMLFSTDGVDMPMPGRFGCFGRSRRIGHSLQRTYFGSTCSPASTANSKSTPRSANSKEPTWT